MARRNELQACMFCGEVPCSCEGIKPKRKRATKAPAAQPRPDAPVAAIKIESAPAPTPLDSILEAEESVEDSPTVKAYKVLYHSSLFAEDSASRARLKHLIEKSGGSLYSPSASHRAKAWRRRNA